MFDGGFINKLWNVQALK